MRICLLFVFAIGCAPVVIVVPPCAPPEPVCQCPEKEEPIPDAPDNPYTDKNWKMESGF